LWIHIIELWRCIYDEKLDFTNFAYFYGCIGTPKHNAASPCSNYVIVCRPRSLAPRHRDHANLGNSLAKKDTKLNVIKLPFP